MQPRASLPQLSEKGLLTPENCVVAIIDLQPQMLFGVAMVHGAPATRFPEYAVPGATAHKAAA